MSFAHQWGIQSHEKDLVFPCDKLEFDLDPSCTMLRGITIKAPPETIFCWLGLLRFSSLSYDLIGSSKKKTLQTQIHSQPDLKSGDIVMDIFEVVGFEKNSHITLTLLPTTVYPVMGLFVSYMIVKNGENSCRLLCKGIMKFKKGLLANLVKKTLPWGDLIMMRKQLLNIKHFTESRQIF